MAATTSCPALRARNASQAKVTGAALAVAFGIVPVAVAVIRGALEVVLAALGWQRLLGFQD